MTATLLLYISIHSIIMTQLHIIFLGTGGSWPTIKRNVTSVAVKRGGEILLFDCGEGTQRQIQKSSISHMQITKIFITHFHGDHFLGLPGLIQTMQLNNRKEPLHIYGPTGMVNLTKSLLSLGYFRPAYEIIPHDVKDGAVLKFNEYQVKVLRVKHNVPAIAYCLEEDMRPGKFNKSKALKLSVPEGPLFSKLQRGEPVTLKNGKRITPDQVLGPLRKARKIVISGDTIPYNKLINFACNADVLVHDATFDSELEDRATEYGHSTAHQAAEIAKKAGVERLFLIHVSPRYMDAHVLEDDARQVFTNAVVPRDLEEFEVKLKK